MIQVSLHSHSSLTIPFRTQWLAQTWGNTAARRPRQRRRDRRRPTSANSADPGPKFADGINADEDAIAALCQHYQARLSLPPPAPQIPRDFLRSPEQVPLVSLRAATLGAVRAGELQ